MTKIKVFILQNGKNRVYLPYAAKAEDLVAVTVSMLTKFNPDRDLKRLQIKGRQACHEITVDSAKVTGFMFDGHFYEYGEVYTRVN